MYQEGGKGEFEQVWHCLGSQGNRIKSKGLSSSNLSLFLGGKALLQFRGCLLSHKYGVRLPESLVLGLFMSALFPTPAHSEDWVILWLESVYRYIFKLECALTWCTPRGSLRLWQLLFLAFCIKLTFVVCIDQGGLGLPTDTWQHNPLH